MKAKAWATIAIPEHHPEMWPGLPGYDDRGGEQVPKAQEFARAPRTRRTLASLTEERDKLTAQRDGHTGTSLPDDPGALSGIRRKRGRADHQADRKTDADLERFTALTKRIDYLNYRIQKE